MIILSTDILFENSSSATAAKSLKRKAMLSVCPLGSFFRMPWNLKMNQLLRTTHQSSFSDRIYWISVFSPNPFSHTEVLLVGYILH